MRHRSCDWWKSLAVIGVLTLLAAAAGCTGGDGYYYCRYDPYCDGGLGAFCDDDRDCWEGVCCDDGNCDGGMCTFECDDDYDCPSEMLCEHHYCFFMCDSDRDCADGQSCEHDNTVCEW